jgi:hypothetical protein
MKKIVKFARQIEILNARYAKGYDGTLDFNFGYICALRTNKLVSTKEANVLLKVYSNEDNDDCRYSIGNSGMLIDADDEESAVKDLK